MDDATINCPMDGTENEPCGTLDQRIYYHCRSCGYWYCAPNEEEEEEDPMDDVNYPGHPCHY